MNRIKKNNFFQGKLKGFPAILIMAKVAVIPAWMPESSAMDGNVATS
jgi:hypothetical protein